MPHPSIDLHGHNDRTTILGNNYPQRIRLVIAVIFNKRGPQMVEFEVPNSPDKWFPARHVACRMAMMTGMSGPLAWDDQDDSTIPSQDGNIWDLGMGFKLEDIGMDLDTDQTGLSKKYRLTHPELIQELEGLQQFVEWVFKNMV